MKTTPTERKARLAAVLLLLLACSAARGQAADAAAPAAVRVIPAPKSVAATGEVFRLTRDARVVLADAKSEDDRFAAEDFADDVSATAGAALRVGAGGGKRQILVGPLSHPRVRAAVERAGVSVPAELGEEGYVLVVNSN